MIKIYGSDCLWHNWRTVNLALIRGSQAIHGASAGVRSPKEGAVQGVRSATKGAVRGTQSRRRYSAEIRKEAEHPVVEVRC